MHAWFVFMGFVHSAFSGSRALFVPFIYYLFIHLFEGGAPAMASATPGRFD